MTDVVVFRGMPLILLARIHRELISSVEIALQLANEQRNAYGLRYNDFTRYR